MLAHVPAEGWSHCSCEPQKADRGTGLGAQAPPDLAVLEGHP
jgi:hypothetical protein